MHRIRQTLALRNRIGSLAERLSEHLLMAGPQRPSDKLDRQQRSTGGQFGRPRNTYPTVRW